MRSPEAAFVNTCSSRAAEAVLKSRDTTLVIAVNAPFSRTPYVGERSPAARGSAASGAFVKTRAGTIASGSSGRLGLSGADRRWKCATRGGRRRGRDRRRRDRRQRFPDCRRRSPDRHQYQEAALIDPSIVPTSSGSAAIRSRDGLPAWPYTSSRRASDRRRRLNPTARKGEGLGRRSRATRTRSRSGGRSSPMPDLVPGCCARERATRLRLGGADHDAGVIAAARGSWNVPVYAGPGEDPSRPPAAREPPGLGRPRLTFAAGGRSLRSGPPVPHVPARLRAAAAGSSGRRRKTPDGAQVAQPPRRRDVLHRLRQRARRSESARRCRGQGEAARGDEPGLGPGGERRPARLQREQITTAWSRRCLLRALRRDDLFAGEGRPSVSDSLPDRPAALTRVTKRLLITIGATLWSPWERRPRWPAGRIPAQSRRPSCRTHTPCSRLRPRASFRFRLGSWGRGPPSRSSSGSKTTARLTLSGFSEHRHQAARRLALRSAGSVRSVLPGPEGAGIAARATTESDSLARGSRPAPRAGSLGGPPAGRERGLPASALRVTPGTPARLEPGEKRSGDPRVTLTAENATAQGPVLHG